MIQYCGKNSLFFSDFLFLGDGAIPFTLEFPDLAPNSVLICADESEDPANVILSFPMKSYVKSFLLSNVINVSARWEFSTTCESTWQNQQMTTRERRAQLWQWGSGRWIFWQFLILARRADGWAWGSERWTFWQHWLITVFLMPVQIEVYEKVICAKPSFRLSLLRLSRSCEALHPLQKRASCLAQVPLLLQL